MNKENFEFICHDLGTLFRLFNDFTLKIVFTYAHFDWTAPMKYQKILYKINPVRLFLKIILSTFYTQKLSENFLFKKKLYRELSALKHKGLEIYVVYDVGARYGRWSKGASKIFPHAKFYLFEASDKCKSTLLAQPFPFFIETLSSKVKNVTFYEKNTPGDSYLKDKSIIYKNSAGITKKTSTIISLIEQKKLPAPDFMKIDTQGSEIDILKGSGKYLKKVKLLYLECPIVNINQGAPDISEYLTFTKKAGFIPLDICEKHIHNNILLQIDILFINKSEVFNLGLINKKHWSFNYL
jgi:FkbM family methyltransferase